MAVAVTVVVRIIVAVDEAVGQHVQDQACDGRVGIAQELDAAGRGFARVLHDANIFILPMAKARSGGVNFLAASRRRSNRS